MSFIIELLGELIIELMVDTLNNPKRPFILRLLVGSTFMLVIILLGVASIQLFRINLFLGLVVIGILVFLLLNIIKILKKKK